MKNKGFTLVELLGVITLLGIIALIAIPTIDALLGKNKDKIYETQLKTIESSLRTWGDVNIKALPDTSGDSITIELGTLKKAGLLDQSFEDTKTETCFQNDLKLTIKRVQNNYTYIVSEPTRTGTMADCTIPSSDYSVGLYGDAIVELSENSAYVDKGCFGIKSGKYDKTVSCTYLKIEALDGQTVNLSSMAKGNYLVTYKVKTGTGFDSNGNVEELYITGTRNITVE